MSFHEHSKKIVEDYLGTVAYVDDLIFSSNKEHKAEVITTTANIREVKSRGIEKEKKTKVGERQLGPNINPLELTNAFLDKGIHCALLEVTNEDDKLDSIQKTLKKSDVIILDWQMHGDLGEKATRLLISSIEDNNLGLRLIIIYTENDDYATILQDSIIPALSDKDLAGGNVDPSGCRYVNGHTKITVLKKGNREDTEVPVSLLPEKIIEEMVEMTAGLISNTALKTVSVIRKNTHNLLGIFNNSLDSAYLGHRAMLPVPEDAEPQIKETIVDSINSIISYSNISEECSLGKIGKWIDISSMATKELNIGTNKKNIKVNISKEDRKNWLKNGYRGFLKSIVHEQLEGRVLSEKELDSFEKFKLKDKASEFFLKDDIRVTGANEEFAILTHHKSDLKNSAYIPYLTLGVLVQKGEKFLLCIQQRCDSIRIADNTERKFLFLPLGENGDYPIIFKNENGEYIKLKVCVKNCYNLQIEKFKQTRNGMVLAICDEDKMYFEDINGLKYNWILDLKDSHAQRIANKFSAELSRVGLDESEWLRRS